MILRVLGSGSSGNCYLLGNETEVLIIEAGVGIAKLKEALNFDLSTVQGLILTHEHCDHAKELHNIRKLGINCYLSKGTAIATDSIKCNRINVINSGEQFKLGNFKIIPFDIRHDAAEPLGYLIHHPECGKILFLTDSKYCDYTFQGLNNIIIEANYSQKIIDEKASSNEKQFLRNRVLNSHLSIENCKELLKVNDLSKVNNIVLIHLSDSNSHEIDFQKQIADLTGKTVITAREGMKIPFEKAPF